NAKVTIESHVTYTDAQGQFSFPGLSSVSHSAPRHVQRIRVQNNHLILPAGLSKRVQLSCFNLAGKKLFTRTATTSANNTSIALPTDKLGMGLLILRIRSRRFNLTAPLLSQGGLVSVQENIASPITTRSQAIEEMLNVKKFGYASKAVSVENYDADLGDIVLQGNEIESRVDSLLALMTIEEKVGQMTQAERTHLEMSEISSYFIGSVLSGGGSTPGDTPEAWADMYDQMQEAALSTRLGIPIMYGTDAVHGNNNLVGAVIFPHNIGLGCTRNPQLIREAGRITAIETAATGIDWTFAPCLAVARDDRWGRTYESFGESPELQTLLAADAVVGYQGDDLSADTTIAACAKHWVADGGAGYGTSETVNGWPTPFQYLVDQGDARISEEMLREIHMPGYVEAVRADVATIMTSYSSWNGQRLHGHRQLITDVLKQELGFMGFVVSDYNGINDLAADYRECVELSINAGIDMVMVPNDYLDFIGELLALVENGRVSQERIDDAVRRILRVKFHLGLFENPKADRSFMARIGSDEHRQVARECVRQSQVLLKNESSALPLQKSGQTIVVIGEHADNVGYQCGGWTMSWQGGSGEVAGGTTIFEGIQQAVENQSLVSFSETGSSLPQADIAVIVFGEEPYAEGWGDLETLSLPDANRVEAIATQCKEAGMKTVGILVSGRPLDISSVLESFDAFMASWLPGTEGGGVADVLFNDHNPTGKLSVSWPASNSQPVNVGDPEYAPLFEYGFGLSY
ncbi:MAG: glycoside hydrolase family 3 protein, partial [Chitinivibrionales bacterium]